VTSPLDADFATIEQVIEELDSFTRFPYASYVLVTKAQAALARLRVALGVQPVPTAETWWCGDCGSVVAGLNAACPKCGPARGMRIGT
jgi:rubrerythrin